MKKILISLSLLLTLSSVFAQPKMTTEQADAIRDLQAQIAANPNMTEAEQKALMMQAMDNSGMIQGMIAQQKEMLPKMYKVMQSLRDCLTNADTKAQAKSCATQATTLSRNLQLGEDFYPDNEDFSWTAQDKQEVLTEMNAGLKIMEKTLPCINSAKNMSDIMNCSQGMH